MKLYEPDESEWDLIAEGDPEGMSFWLDGYSVISEASGLLSHLDEAGLDESCYEEFIDDESYFDDFSSMSFPPLYDLREIEVLDGFLHVEEDEDYDEDDEEGASGMSYLFTRIYIEKSKKKEIIEAFTRLVEKLKSYPPIQEFI